VAKADDSSLDPEELRAVQAAARRALDRASAWGMYPTPTAVILEAASLKIAPTSAFDPRRITEYLLGKAESAAVALKSAIAKVFGIYDAGEQLIHIDDSVHKSKKREVPSLVIGNLSPWTFERAWHYWIAKGPGIPADVAEQLHRTLGRDVRVNGHCGCPSPLEQNHGFAVGLYHVDTPAGLKALADTIKRVDVRRGGKTDA
jgi:hypothetical protein